LLVDCIEHDLSEPRSVYDGRGIRFTDLGAVIRIATTVCFRANVDYDFPTAALMIMVVAVNLRDDCEKEGE